jgi:5'-nucleotidase
MSGDTGERSPRILVTNDDGVESPGIHRLATALARHHDVVVAAPESNMSGAGTGIGQFESSQPVALTRGGVEGVETFAVSGPPGLAVMAGALGAFGEVPDLVVSGVNAGINTGHSIIHSGTVGAALTAHTFGSHGLAVSLARSDPWQWDTAVQLACRLVPWLLDRPTLTTINLNVPALPASEMRGVKWADLDAFGYFRVATAADTELQFEVRDASTEPEPGSDTALCLDGYATLTALSPIEQAATPRMNLERVFGPDGDDRPGPRRGRRRGSGAPMVTGEIRETP